MAREILVDDLRTPLADVVLLDHVGQGVVLLQFVNCRIRLVVGRQAVGRVDQAGILGHHHAGEAHAVTALAVKGPLHGLFDDPGDRVRNTAVHANALRSIWQPPYSLLTKSQLTLKSKLSKEKQKVLRKSFTVKACGDFGAMPLGSTTRIGPLRPRTNVDRQRRAGQGGRNYPDLLAFDHRLRQGPELLRVRGARVAEKDEVAMHKPVTGERDGTALLQVPLRVAGW